jgi:ArsR family transcriptional regulator
LGEPARLRLLALAATEELSIGELAEVLDESQPNVSRHLGALKQAGLVALRREGTRSYVRVAEGAFSDAVVGDALREGRDLCEREQRMGRIAGVLRARESSSRDYFARVDRGDVGALAPETPAYLAAVGALCRSRVGARWRVAVDVGTGDGALLDVLSPFFEQVVAIDRSEARLGLARERAARHGLENVHFAHGEPTAKTCAAALGAAGGGGQQAEWAGADAVFCSRVLHHAARPQAFFGELAALLAPGVGASVTGGGGGALVIVDYEPHEDERLRDHADVWLGFSKEELARFASAAGLSCVHHAAIGAPRRGSGPDAHLPWQLFIAVSADAAHGEFTPSRRTSK